MLWVQSPVLHNLNMVTQPCNASPLEVEAGKLEIQVMFFIRSIKSSQFIPSPEYIAEVKGKGGREKRKKRGWKEERERERVSILIRVAPDIVYLISSLYLGC